MAFHFPPLAQPTNTTAASSSTTLPLAGDSHSSSSNSLLCVQQPWEDSRFGEKDSDVRVQSADGFIFQLHRAVLEMNTGVFPGPEIPTNDEPVKLTENANVLAILFSFIYPKRHPDLEDEDFQIVSAVAEAAGKYDVFAAVNTCNMQLMQFLPQHALDIFVHAIKHDHPKLMHATVPHFCRSPLSPVLKRLPPGPYMLAWAQHHEAWQGMFKAATGYIKSLPVDTMFSPCHDASKSICAVCRSSLFIMISDLEAIEDTSALNSALRHPSNKYPFLACCEDSQNPKAVCRHVVDLANLCREKIKIIPAFATFLSPKD